MSTENYESQPPFTKRLMARVYDRVGLAKVDALIDRLDPNFILGVNYHKTPASLADRLDAQLNWLKERYTPVDRRLLQSFLEGNLRLRKPGIMVHFDDGFENHLTVAAPILERHGIDGWFHVVMDRVDAATAGDPSVPAHERSITWDQARELVARGHEVCSHTMSHHRMRSSLSQEQVRREVVASRDRLKAMLGIEPVGFCWPGGESDAYDARAMKLVVETYKYAFPSYSARIRSGTPAHALTRSNVEAHWGLDVMQLSYSRLWELKHRARAKMYRSRLASTQ